MSLYLEKIIIIIDPGCPTIAMLSICVQHEAIATEAGVTSHVVDTALFTYILAIVVAFIQICKDINDSECFGNIL